MLKMIVSVSAESSCPSTTSPVRGVLTSRNHRTQHPKTKRAGASRRLLIWLALFIIIIPVEDVEYAGVGRGNCGFAADFSCAPWGVRFLSRRWGCGGWPGAAVGGCSWQQAGIVLAAFVLWIALVMPRRTGVADTRGKIANVNSKPKARCWVGTVHPAAGPGRPEFFQGAIQNDRFGFVRGQHGTEIAKCLQNSNTFSVITTGTAANNYLAWCNQSEGPD